jgi:hypothetical protein
MYLIFIFILLLTTSYAEENSYNEGDVLKNIIESSTHSVGNHNIPSPGGLVTHSVSSFFPKVNPVSGEYVEEESDLVVAGCEPISFRRFYGHLATPDCRFGAWRINPETSIVANFLGPSPQSAAVGEGVLTKQSEV